MLQLTSFERSGLLLSRSDNSGLFRRFYTFRGQRSTQGFGFGLSFKSQGLNDYYWGVPADDTNIALPGYTAGSGLNAHARLQFSYQISRNWMLSFVSEVERMNDEAAGSPIVEEQNVFGYFAGFGYRFY